MVVVQLERRPGRRAALPAVALRVARGVERLERDAVAHDVVRVRVAARRVVRRDDVRTELAHELDQRRGRLLERHETERALGQRRQRVPLGQPRVDEPEPLLPDAERARRGGHLDAAQGAHALDVRRALAEARVEDVATLAPGARGDEHVHALGRVARRRRGALARLVVGVGVHGQETERLRLLAVGGRSGRGFGHWSSRVRRTSPRAAWDAAGRRGCTTRAGALRRWVEDMIHHRAHT